MKTFFKVFTCVWLSLFAIAELIMLIGIVGATVDPAAGNDPIEPISMVVILFIAFGVFLAIDIGGLVRVAGGKSLVFFSTLLMKLFAGAVGFTAIGIAMDDERDYVLYAVLLAICLVIGLAAFFLGRYTDKISPELSLGVGPAVMLRRFECEKVEWSMETAAQEYFGREIVPESAYADAADKISQYAAMPMASYICWLLRRGLLTHEFYSDIPEETVKDVMEGRQSPTILLGYTDEVFTREMIDESARSFTDTYYWNSLHDSFRIAYDHDCQSYQFDYFEIVGGGKDHYVNEFSPEKQLMLEHLLDKRFAASCGEEDPHSYPSASAVNSELFGCRLSVKAPDRVSDDYIRACIEQISHPDKELVERIGNRLNEFRDGYAHKPFTDNDDIFKLFGARLMIVYPPEANELAYSIIGGGSLEKEHGCGFTVRDRYVSRVVYEDEVLSPWSGRFVREKRLEDLDSERLRTMCIFPYECGGTQSAENTVSAPEVVADFKDECDRRMICLLKQGVKLNYLCEPIYEDGRVIGVSAAAAGDDRRNVFYDRICAPRQRRPFMGQ